MILQQHTRQWYDLLTILLTRWHGKVLKLCLIVDFILKLLAHITLGYYSVWALKTGFQHLELI